MARQRHPVPVEQADGLALGHPRPQPGQHAPEAVGRLAGGVLERRQLLDLVRGAQAAPRVDQQVRRVLDQAARAGQPAQLVDEEGRRLHRGSVRVRLPADDPDPSPGTDALAAEDLGQRPGSIARLPGQADVLEQDAAHRQGCGARGPEALVADEDRGLLGRADDRDRLLESWVEAGQPGEVGAVLSIGVDDQSVVAATVHRLAKAVQARGVDLGRDQRLSVGHPELGQWDVGQPGAVWSRGHAAPRFPAAKIRSMTRRLATASSGGVGVGRSSRMAAAKSSASARVRVLRREGQRLGRRCHRRVAARGHEHVRRPVGRDVERDLDRQPPLAAVDVDALIGLDAGRAGERRDAVVELEDRAGQRVDAAHRIADDRGLDRAGLGTEQHARQVDRVAADVEQRPAACLELVPDVRRIVVVVREPALDRAQPAEPAGRHDLHRGDPRRVVAIHERLHQPDAGVRAGLDHPLRVGRGHGQRLLAQDVLPGTGSGEGPLGMEVVRQRDVDDVHVGIGEERLVRAVGGRDAELVGDGACLGRVPRRDRHDLAARGLQQAGDDLLARDVGRRQDAPAQARHRSLRFSVRMLDTDRGRGPVCHNIWKEGTQTR